MRRPSLIAVVLATLAATACDRARAAEETPPKAREAKEKPAKEKNAKVKQPKDTSAKPAASPEARARIAAFALRQTEFGSISLLPVRFEKSRLAGPFEDGGRQLYCVSSRMKGRSITSYERAKVIIRDANGVLTRLDEDEEVCEGHRTEPFPELEVAGRE